MAQTNQTDWPLEQLLTYCPTARGLTGSEVSQEQSLRGKGPSLSRPLHDLCSWVKTFDLCLCSALHNAECSPVHRLRDRSVVAVDQNAVDASKHKRISDRLEEDRLIHLIDGSCERRTQQKSASNINIEDRQKSIQRFKYIQVLITKENYRTVVITWPSLLWNCMRCMHKFIEIIWKEKVFKTLIVWKI